MGHTVTAMPGRSPNYLLSAVSWSADSDQLPAPDPSVSRRHRTRSASRSPQGAGTAGGSPRVTVVTPSFNQAPFLEETISSVLGQAYPNLEYMIVDGGSTDGSVDIIKKYDSELAWWVSEPDRGQSHAINKGWARATGDIIAYLNSDDLYLPGAISSSVAYLQEHPDIDLVYARAHHIDEHGRVFARIRPPEFSWPAIIHSCFIAQPTVFFRRSLLERIGFLNESLHYSFDYEYWLRAARFARLGLLPRFTAAARYHTSSKSSTLLGRFFVEEVEMLDRLFADGTLPPLDEKITSGAYLRRLLYIAGSRSGCTQEERECALERLRLLTPPPSGAEITDVLAGHDAFLATPYAGASVPGDGSAVVPDAVQAVSPLLAAGIVERNLALTVTRRLVACAAIANASIRSPGTVLSALLITAAGGLRDPGIWRQRRWWYGLARALRLQRVARDWYAALSQLANRAPDPATTRGE